MKTEKKQELKTPEIEKKVTRKPSKNGATAASTKGRSATQAVKADANSDVRGSSGIANTGPLVSYNDGE